ncbi:MAG: class I SAM-dependent methyltransferase [Kordiimonadaceae bacterium]|nr:class I SAM-dependent methyltransferase [Kordiimonadaceae bacterium]
MRPHQYYKKIFRQAVGEVAPASVLDVGCGKGDWVHELRAQGIEAYGLDTAEAEQPSSDWIKVGSASALPFADKSVDLVTSEFSAHHFPDLALHLKEACRVARKGIAVLDPWYDGTVASQRTARSLDEWFKRIDQAAGEVHNFVISADAFLQGMPSEISCSASFQHLLKLEPIPEMKYEAWFSEYTAKSGGNPDRLQDLAEIQRQILASGLSQDGAIIFTALFDES